MQIFTQIILTTIAEIYNVTGSLGWSLIIFTIVVRSLLLPLTLPSLKAANKMKEMQPHIKKLKVKYGSDKTALQKAQLELFKTHNVNPLAGCLPQLVQIGILILLYHVLINFFKTPLINGEQVNTAFFWMNLATPDKSFILPILAAGTQLILSFMILPGAEKKDEIPNDSKNKKVQEANKKEGDFADMAASMQQQMLFIMPLMTGIFAYQFPAGLALYWVITTIFSIGQQYFISGLGGIKIYYQRIIIFIKGRLS